MKTEISLELIKKFNSLYNTKENREDEKHIIEEGIYDYIIDRNVIKENKREFSIELPQLKRENQQESSRCWIYAGINFLKYDVFNKLNCNINDIDFSCNYISFFDKLEKCNSIYEAVINNGKTSLTDIFKIGITEWGYWIYFVEIIEKYGLVPLNTMPENKNSYNSDFLLNILNEKVKKDVYDLLKKRESCTTEEIKKYKEIKLFEIYNILSKTLGEPKYCFNYSYINKHGEKIRFENVTPIEFKNKITTNNLRDYVAVASFEMENKDYYKKYEKRFYQDIYERTYPTYINVPKNELKELTIKQLKDGMAVRFSSEIRKDIDNKNGIMDCRIFNYNKLQINDRLSTKELLESKESFAAHAMIFTGVNIKNDKPNRWKVEDTRNTSRNYEGSYVMNDNFFDKYVYAVYINKKYLTDNQIKAYKSNSIPVDIDDVF